MIIESSQVSFQSLQDQRESVAVSSRLSIGRQQANSSDLEYEAKELESVQLYSRVTDGDITKNHAQQRLAREVVSLEQSSYEPTEPELRRAEDGNASVTFSQYRYVTESQSSLITSSGTITLEDGRSVNFNLYVERGRETELAVEQTLKIQGRQLTDPLVLNFAADILSLDSNTFFFDLDSDGDQESIAALGAGSGYLVLDVNQNGEVDDGSELFGPQTGSGFGELARYDSDGNRWIDEADPVFEQLRVWVDAGTENQRLATLSEVGVGAIYLGATADRFDLVDGQGRTLGQTKAAGIMLMENGEVRTVQELDLADQRGQTAITDQDLQPSNAEVRQASGFSEVAARLRELRERQERQLEAIGENSKFVSPLQQLIEKLEALRQRVMEQLKMTTEVDEATVLAKTFNRDEMTYQLMRSKLKL